MVDWQQVAIDFVLGAVPPAELPAIAEGDLRSPDQPEAMFELAFSEGCERHIIERHFRGLLDQLCLTLPSRKQAVEAKIREVAAQVVQKELSPQEALNRLHGILGIDFYRNRELLSLDYLADELEVFPEWRDRYSNELFKGFSALSDSFDA
jgi:hypothetical protein